MKSKIKTYKKIVFFLIALGLTACSVKKYIPENEVLYTGGAIDVETEEKIKDLGEIKDELDGLLRPVPNSKFLGVRWGLLTHYKSQKENPGFINRFLNKKIGEEPIYLSDVDVTRTEELINNRLENRGFFKNTIASSVEKNLSFLASDKLNGREAGTEGINTASSYIENIFKKNFIHFQI